MRTVTVSHNWYSFPRCLGIAVLTVFGVPSDISCRNRGRVCRAWSGLVGMEAELGHSLTLGRSPALYLDNRGWDRLGVTNSWIFFELLLRSTCYLETIYIAYKSIQNYDGWGPSDRWYVYVYVSVWTKLTINKPPEQC